MALLITSNPELVEQLHPTLNEGIDLATLSNATKRKVWWIDALGHEWEAAVNNRAYNNAGCPYCYGRKVLAGFNDLMSQSPQLMQEWNFGRNTINPEEVHFNSTQIAWWIGSCGHEWESSIGIRAKANTTCPYCAGRRVLTGFNDINTTHPALSLEWHPTKNKKDTPFTVSAGSNKKVWWQDVLGHEWEATVDKRARSGRGCPVCSGNKVSKGFNDMATTHPSYAQEIDPTINNGIDGTVISAGSTQFIRWTCAIGHNWDSAPCDRIGYAVKCPTCSNKKILKGYNDLEALFPELMSEWNFSKNSPLLPSEISSGSNKKVWWICNKGHEWLQTPCQRSVYDYSCPFCSTGASKAENDIADFLVLQGLKVERKNREILSGLELDILIAEKNIAIEFNGIYWHSEKYKEDKNYHYSKWKTCHNQNIQLIQIWEDEWNKNPEMIRNMLSYKLGLGDAKKRIFARKCKVVNLDVNIARDFLEENHIQGYASGSYYYGLMHENALNAVIVLKKEGKDTLNIIRYATNSSVVGGFTKILSYAEKVLSPKYFVTFSDNCVSDGNLYAGNGFIVDKELPPDYRYLWRGQRKHKFGYRLEEFKKNPSLTWVEGLTEKQLAEINGLYRIWDAGKIKWKRTVVS